MALRGLLCRGFFPRGRLASSPPAQSFQRPWKRWILLQTTGRYSTAAENANQASTAAKSNHHATDDVHPQYQLRPARPEDHRAVVDIHNDVHSGLDYLDFAFPFYISHPKVHCYVGELGDKMVSFVLWYILDDGVLQAGGRIRPEFDGQGHLIQLSEYTVKDFKKRKLVDSSVDFIYCVFSTPSNKARLASQPEMYQPVLQRNIRNYRFTLGDVQRWVKTREFSALCQTYNVDDVIRPTFEEFKDVFRRDATTPFVDEHMVTFWTPFRVDPANAVEVYDNSVPLLTRGESSTDDVTSGGAVSFLRSVCCRDGARYDVEFYGSDPRELQKHVLKALRNLGHGQSFTDPDLDMQLVVYFPESMEDILLQNLADSRGWKQGLWTHYGEKYLVIINHDFYQKVWLRIPTGETES